MKLSLGPVLFYWDKQQLGQFYSEMASLALDVIYLGETVCSKRRAFNLDQWLGLGRELRSAGNAQIVLSSLTLIEAASELSSLRRLCDNGEVLVEAYIDGKELTVGIVDDEVLPVIEIRAPDNTYDYRAKYTKGVTEYLTPAPIDAAATRLCQDLSARTYRALAGRGMGRVDLRMQPDGRMYVLELNAIPGFTDTSLLPKAARVAGYAFSALCDRIMRTATVT